MGDIAIKTAWQAKRTKNTVIYDHVHNFYELVYYCYGSGTTWIGETRYDLSPDTFLVVPPNLPHGEVFSADAKVYCLGFSAEEPVDCGLLCDNAQAVRNRIKEILLESAEQPLYYQKMSRLKLQEIFIEIERLRSRSSRRASSKDFDYLINYLSENYTEKIALHTLAAQVYLSYDYFQHRFKELTGLSPQQFLIKKRLEAAANLLKEQTFNCTEIAQRCGFCNSAQFSMLFKRTFGITPVQYRKQGDNSPF